MRPSNKLRLAVLILLSIIPSQAFSATPSITSLTPTSAAAGASVTIKGTSFGTSQGTSTVTFNGTPGTPTTWANTSIKVPVPAGATTGNVVVMVSGLASNGVSFTVLPIPSITSLTPSSDPVDATVTIAGTNFGATQGNSTVVFNSKKTATPITWANGSIQVPVPSGATTGNVVVTVSGVASNGVSFTVLPTPSITSLTPTSGAVGASVTIKGTSFGASQGSSSVTFNGTLATPTTWANTSIKVPVPAGTTTGNVVVTVNGVVSNRINFTVLPTPSITSLTPSSGPVGSVVTIAGTNFGATQGSSTIVFNKTTATSTAWSNTSIQVPVPAGATTGNVIVTVSGVASSGVSFTVLPTPNITSLTPTSAAVGVSVTIKGTNFGTSQGLSSVTFNGTPGTPTTWANTSIKVPVPAGATTGYVVVTVDGVSSNGISFIVPGTTATITNLSPSSGPVGSQVSISGAYFDSSQGSSTVSFNGSLATSIVSWSSTLIVAIVPSGATSGKVVVMAGGVASNGVSFTVLPTPSITGLSPTSGPVGTSITLSGTNFGSTQGTSTVTFNGTTAAPTNWNATSIVVPVPAGATTGNIVVTVGSVPSAGVPFTVLPTPSITSLSPTSGGVGTLVTINGTNFGSMAGTSTVTFNGTTAIPSSWSATSIVVAVPTGATTGNVLVTVSGVASNGTPFTVSPPPGITGLSPTSGGVGTSVTITGANFGSTQGTNTVTFNGTAATPTSWSATSIIVPVPAGATSGSLSVTVGGQTAYSASFTVTALPSGWLDVDVGAVGLAGNSSYANGTFTVSGAGQEFGGTADAFHFVYQPLSGDGSIAARVNIPAGGVAGVMIRETLDAGSPYGATAVTGSFRQFSVRTAEDGTTSYPGGISLNSPYWVEMVRSGSTLSSYVSQDGANWTLVGNQTVNMVQNVYIGLVVASGLASPTLDTQIFDSASVNSLVTPAPVISIVSATTGSIGSQVLITGSNFGASQGSSSVTLNVTPVTIDSWSNTSISITIPSGATSGPLVVSVSPSMNNSNAVPFTVTGQPLASGWLDADVGLVGIPGSSSYANGTFTVNGAGSQIGGTADAFHFVYQILSGDGSIAARVHMPAGGTAGVMIRASLDPGSANGATLASEGSFAQFAIRTTEDGTTSYPGDVTNLTSLWVELVRSGNTLSSYASPDGVNWALAASQTIDLPSNVYVGLVFDSGTAAPSLATATFDNVSLNFTGTPAPVITSVSATTGPTGSQVEIFGANFGASQGSSAVTLNVTPVIVNSWSDTSISITIPSGATSGPLVVSVAPTMNNSNPVVFTLTSQPLPSGWLDADVGAVGQAGNSSYASGIFTVNGAGSQFYGGTDAFHFVYQTLSGDGTIVAQVSMPSGGLAGVMIRQSLDPGSLYAATMSYGSYSQFDVRTVADGSTSYPGGVYNLTSPFWVELVRSGSTFSSYASSDGVNWTLAASQAINMTADVYVGLVMSSGATSSLGTATFNNVAISFSPPVVTPAITSVSPNFAAPTASVIISGENFGATQGTSTLTFNGMPSAPAFWSATEIDVPVPSGATSGNIVVTVNGAASNAVPFTVSQAPTIASLSPTSGAVGASVVIAGVNFGSTQGSSTVTFNGTAATPTSWSANSIVVPVPGGATTGNLVVTAGGSSSNILPFTVLQPPGITGLSAVSATIGASITITGTNFGSTQSASTVTFNGVGGTPASWSPTSIVVPVPVGATTGSVVVTVNGVASNAVALTIGLLSLPPVAQIRPANGSTGFPENGRVIVRFAQPVQSAAVVTGTITLVQGVNNVGGTLALSNDGLSVTFTPALNLAANSTFTVSVADVTGNQTAPEFQSTFTTGPTTDSIAPTIAQTSPQGGNTGVPISAPIVVQFSKPMDPASLTPQSFTVSDPVTGPLPGMVQVDPTGTTASFIPRGFLAVGRTFSVSLSDYSTVEDSSGNSLQGNNTNFSFTTSFSTDTTAPQVLGMSPSNATTAIPLNALIALEFSKPLDIISVSNGLQVQAGGQPVSGAIALSNSNQLVTFTPLGGLAANTTYTVATTSQITDVGGLGLANPGSFSLTTGSTTDATTPSVTTVSPSSNETGVPINGIVQLHFSKPIDPFTVTSAAVQVTYGISGVLAGTLSVSTDGLTATFASAGQLEPFTAYYVQANADITDIEGNPIPGIFSSFTTGSATDSSAPTVLMISPANGATGVPANVRVDLVMSAPLSAASVSNNSIVVSSGGTAVPGSISLNSSDTIVTFIPATLLAANTTYTVAVSGLTDQAGNAVGSFTSTFTTATSGAANTTTPTVVSISPVNGATAVSVSSPIVLTFNEAIDATTVNDTTVPVSVNGASGVLAGGYALDATGTVLKFTPLSPLPGSVTVTVEVNSGVLDLSGNMTNSFSGAFTTGAGTDTTAPLVAMVTPQNQATGIGANAQAVLTFSKSLSPVTINTNNFGLLANGSALGISISTSADNRVVTLSPYGGVPASSTIAILATNSVTDLSGNALTNFQSQFTTATSAPAPTVASQRPGNGATGVPLNSSVVLYMSEAMNASSVQGALEVSQNGTLVSGTTQVTDNGQVIQFTPTTQWQPGALVQVFLTPSAQSTSGNSANNYQGSFTVVPDANTTAPMLISTNPVTQVSGVPTNVVIDFAFNEPLDPTALLPDTITCLQNGTWFQTGVSVLNGGTLLQVTPRLPLPPGSSVNCILNNGIQGVNGLPLSYYSSNAMSFTTGVGPDTGVPLILTSSPPNGSANVGDNGDVTLGFSKAMNPLTVNANSIQLSAGGVSLAADSISFSNNNQSALLVPHSPLPDATPITLTISGVTDVAGNLAASQTTQFTTGSGPDVVPPVVLTASPSQGAQNVPLNTIIMLQMSQPVDPGTVGGSTLTLVNNATGQIVAGAYAVSADGLTITFVPGSPLTASASFSVSFPGAGFGTGVSDLAGNSLQGTTPVYFTTGTSASTTAPEVVGVSPANGATAIPINAQVVIQFNEPVDGSKLSGVVFTAGSSPVNVSQSLTNGNERLSLIPAVPLSANTAYSLTIAGVQDFSGNVLSPAAVGFTTGTGADLTPATVAVVSPANNATGVSANAAVTVTFSKPIDPLTVSTNTMQLIANTTSIPVAGTVSSNGTSAIFTPNLPLDLMTQYQLHLTNGVTDMEGQSLYTGSYTSYFTTGGGTSAEPPTIASVVQAAGFVGSTVVISGTYFGTSQNSSTVTFNGVAGTPSSWTDTTISVPVPSGATSGPVVVTVNGVASNGITFNVDATPTIASISPSSGTAGTIVTITGTSLGDAQDSIQVTFNGIIANPSSANETSLVVTVPAGGLPGTFTPTVNVNGYFASGPSFTVIPTPIITMVNPNTGVSGTPVTIMGNYFGDTQGSSSVTFNGVPAASITSWSAQYITAVPPSNETTGPVVVVVNSIPSTSTNNIFNVTNPAIGSVVPPAAAPGSIVTVYGSGFEPQFQQTMQVLFNGVPSQSIQCTAYYCSSEPVPYGSLFVEVPNGASTGPVTVVVGGITSNSVNFTIEAQPTIASVSPSTGPFDGNGNLTPITITGTGFGATQSISSVNFFGSNTAPSIVSWSDTSITLMMPSDAGTGPLNVQVGGLFALAPSYFYVNSITDLTDSLGNQSQYTVSAQGGTWFATSSTGTGCATCSLRGNITNVPDANGNTLSTTDDQGNVTSYTYDPNNNVASISKPLNPTATATTSYTYNSFGEVLTMTDPLGNVTTNTYDANGNLLTVTSPAASGNIPASVTQFQYAANGELTQISDPNGNPTTLTYTAAGLIASITDALHNTTTYQYDSLGNRTAVIDPVNGPAHPTSFTYDAMSRLTGITYPDNNTASFTYDIRGRRITSTDQNGKITYYTYDDADRLTAVTDPANDITQYNYDTEDNLLSITDANNHTTSFSYNARGWVTQTLFPSTLAESYTYDLVGNLVSKTDRKGNTIQYVYDALYRLLQKTYPDSTNVEYAYDLAGKVLQVSDPTGSYGFAYDNMGRLIGTTTQYSFLPGVTETNSYTYDAASNRTSLTAPDGSISTYGYDTDNRLNGLANTWAGSFGFAYDALSRRTQLTRPNGITTSYAYDSVSHLLGVLHQAGLNTLDGASYTYDAAGNRTAKTNYLNSTTSNYTYDPLYELTQVSQGGSTTESYSYDFVGNRLSSSGVPNYSYNSSNELTSNSTGSYTYDANGNTLSDPTGKSYIWDFENRLAQAIVPGTGSVAFKYDPLGRRIQKSGPLGTTNYLYDGMARGANIIEEVDSSGNVLAKYTREPRVDGPLSMLRGGTTAYYEQDGVNSVTSLSTSAGAVANSYTYDSFGNLTASTGTLTNPFQFTSRDYDAETSLQFNRTRYYDSRVGRFVSEDLIRFKGGIDFYSYVKNRPVTFTDPLGTCLLQWDSVTATLGKCPLDPITNSKCECLCSVSPEHDGCMKDCKDGCLSSKLSAVDSCQCLCNKAHGSGELNGFETWVCKQFCKAGGK